MRSKQYDILLVDDDPEDRLILGEAFAELGCQDHVMMYDSGFSFLKDLEELKSLSPLPFLIVLDHNLPGLTGLEILHTLKNDPVLSMVPAVMYSTGMSPKLRQQCRDIGGQDCFEKGSTYNEIIAFAKALCQQAFKASSAT